MLQFLKSKKPHTKQEEDEKKEEHNNKDKPTPVDFLVHVSLAVDKPEDFKNEFGFDYMRTEYENIIQTDYEDLKAEYCVCNNIESYVLGKPYYTPWLAMFKDHKKITGYEVKLKLHTQKLEETPNDEIDAIQFACPVGIAMYDEEGNTKIEKLKYSEINDKIIQIKCTQSFSEHQYIAVVHAETKHSLGFLNLYKNNPAYRLNVKFVKVKFKGEVIFKTTDDKGKTTGHINFNNDTFNIKQIDPQGNIFEYPHKMPDHYTTAEQIKKYKLDTSLNTDLNLSNMINYIEENAKNTKKYLAQALIQLDIQPKLEEIKVDVESYDKQKPITMIGLPGIKKIKESIETQWGKDIQFNYNQLLLGLQELYSYHKKPDPGIVIFIMPINIVLRCSEKQDAVILEGYTKKINKITKFIMLTKPTAVTQKLPSVLAHQIAHSLGLVPTFQPNEEMDSSTNSSKHHFYRGTTDNLMDHTSGEEDFPKLTSKNKKKDMLWKWQWDIMQQDVQDLTIIKE